MIKIAVRGHSSRDYATLLLLKNRKRPCCGSMRGGHPTSYVSGTGAPVHLDCAVSSPSIKFRVTHQPFREVRCAREPCVRYASPGNRFAHS